MRGAGVLERGVDHVRAGIWRRRDGFSGTGMGEGGWISWMMSYGFHDCLHMIGYLPCCLIPRGLLLPS